MKWVLAQISADLGAFKANQKKIISASQKHPSADLIIFPELSLAGYPPEDLLENSLFLKNQNLALEGLRKKAKAPLLFGAVVKEQEKLFNSAVYIYKKQKKSFHKSFLAEGDVFDEGRFFDPGSSQNKILKIKNKNILVLICEDLWKIKKLPLRPKIDFIVCLNGSPFFPEQFSARETKARRLALQLKAPLAYVNQVGGQDELIFDGSSFVLNSKGEKVCTYPAFKEHIEEIDMARLSTAPQIKIKKETPVQLKKQALVLGIKDFVEKSGFKNIHLGLSGGADSALTALLCKEALGKNHVQTFFLPGPYTKKLSRRLSESLALTEGLPWREHSITPFYHDFLKSFPKPSSIMRQNLQARLRCLFLMSYANNFSSLLIGAGNKSELALGYATLYGDLAGALLPIGDLYKIEVQEMLAQCFSSTTIKHILKREPSAELLPGQKDTDDLPPYSLVDPVLKNILEKKKIPKTLMEKETAFKILKSEFKRRQCPPVLKVSPKSFGRGRRHPCALNQSELFMDLSNLGKL